MNALRNRSGATERADQPLLSDKVSGCCVSLASSASHLFELRACRAVLLKSASAHNGIPSHQWTLPRMGTD
jgi:hypothetical protein